LQGDEARDVSTRTVKPRDDAASDGVAHAREDNRDRPCLPLEANSRRGPAGQDDVGFQANQLLRERSYSIVIAGPPEVHPHVAAIGPTQVSKRLRERRDHSLRHGIAFVPSHEHADPSHAVALLCPCPEWPSRHAAEPRYELPPSHLWSAATNWNEPSAI
jgi:hypothetical protein